MRDCPESVQEPGPGAINLSVLTPVLANPCSRSVCYLTNVSPGLVGRCNRRLTAFACASRIVIRALKVKLPVSKQRLIHVAIYSPGDHTVASAAWRNRDTEVSY